MPKLNTSLLPERLWLAVCVGLGAFVRFHNIAKSSVWYDEGYTLMLSPRSPAQIWAADIRDVHPPLYYLVLHYWMLLFGNSETAARSLSAVCMLGAIVVVYFLIKRLFNPTAARLAALFVAIGPYMVRFSQEARMYGMVSFWLVLATFFLVRAVQDGRRLDWVGYSLAIAAGLYTHYYTIFIVVVHWIYLQQAYRPKPTDRFKLFKWLVPTWSWVLAGVGSIALFTPWLPHAISQFSKVSAGFWIAGPPPDTVARTLIQFMTFNNLDRPNAQAVKISTLRFNPVSTGWHLLAYLVFLGVIYLAFKFNRQKRAELTLITAYALVPSILVFILSLRRAIYLDRYFTFAAVGFYALLGVLLSLNWFRQKPLPIPLRAAFTTLIAAVLIWGIGNVYAGENHHMRETGDVLNTHAQPGDDVISAELYTFFDLSYYNHTGNQLKLLSGENIDGYGVTSLIYDRLGGIIVNSLTDEHPSTHHAWIVAQETREDFFTKVPKNWHQTGPRYHNGRVETQEFVLD